MGLLSSLKSRFFPPVLCRIAKSGNAADTAECLTQTSIVVIGADLGVSVPFDADEDSVLSMVKAAAQKKPFDGNIHKYHFDGETFLPIFTDNAAADSFCAAYCTLLGHVHAFRLFTIPGACIRHWLMDDDIIVVNPQSDNEVEIGRGDSQAIREQLPETATFDDVKFLALVFPMVGVSRTIEFAPDT